MNALEYAGAVLYVLLLMILVVPAVGFAGLLMLTIMVNRRNG
ncbi:MAG: hypothetical protein WC670_18335 [Pseudolabrys sp.]|jgi:hypothetical protein